VVDWAAITAIGTVLAGLALPLAFVQLEAQRRERLRAQVSQVGAWTRIYGVSEEGDWPAPRILVGEPAPERWRIEVAVRNSSQLPVLINKVELNVRTWGYDLVPRNAAGTNFDASKRFADTRTMLAFVNETIEPEFTQTQSPTPVSREADYTDGSFELPQPPIVSINVIVVTDASGRLWEIRPSKARPPRRVPWWVRKQVL
jgi:hypothetical protein